MIESHSKCNTGVKFIHNYILLKKILFFADAWVIWIQIVFKIHIYRKMCQSAIFKAKVKGEGHLNFKVKPTII